MAFFEKLSTFRDRNERLEPAGDGARSTRTLRSWRRDIQAFRKKKRAKRSLPSGQDRKAIAVLQDPYDRLSKNSNGLMRKIKAPGRAIWPSAPRPSSW
jgi:hypothetical protein